MGSRRLHFQILNNKYLKKESGLYSIKLLEEGRKHFYDLIDSLGQVRGISKEEKKNLMVTYLICQARIREAFALFYQDLSKKNVDCTAEIAKYKNKTFIWYDEAIKKDNKAFEIYLWKARTAALFKFSTLAMQSYAQALKAQPSLIIHTDDRDLDFLNKYTEKVETSDSYLCRGLILYHLGLDGKASIDFQTVIEKNENPAIAHFFLAKMVIQQKNLKEDYKKDFRRALELDPTLSLYWTRKEILFLHKKHPDWLQEIKNILESYDEKLSARIDRKLQPRGFYFFCCGSRPAKIIPLSAPLPPEHKYETPNNVQVPIIPVMNGFFPLVEDQSSKAQIPVHHQGNTIESTDSSLIQSEVKHDKTNTTLFKPSLMPG